MPYGLRDDCRLRDALRGQGEKQGRKDQAHTSLGATPTTAQDVGIRHTSMYIIPGTAPIIIKTRLAMSRISYVYFFIDRSHFVLYPLSTIPDPVDLKRNAKDFRAVG